MAQAITVGTNFSQLDISGNRITSEGIMTFLHTIQTNTALKLKNLLLSGEQCHKVRDSWNN